MDHLHPSSRHPAPTPAGGGVSPSSLGGPAKAAWRIVQGLLWIGALLLIVALFRWPSIGLHVLWDILIPVAPLLLVLAPGLWRNICPLATTALLPRHLGASLRLRLPAAAQGTLHAAAVLLLFLIVPLRHSSLNTDGSAAAVVLLATGALALLLGSTFEWKSAWCASLCPVHPVERLYGAQPLLTLPNAHCDTCQRCTAVCPDSTPRMTPLTGRQSLPSRLATFLLVGGFPGYIWGWFQVPDFRPGRPVPDLVDLYRLPVGGLFASLAIFIGLRRFFPAVTDSAWCRASAAASLIAYYVHRLPMLVGLGPFPEDGVLVDLRAYLPGWTHAALQALTVVFFFVWMAAPRDRRSWARRPVFGEPAEPVTARFPVRLQETRDP